MLTENEKTAVKVLNFIAEHDGIITHEDEVLYLLKRGIIEFISTKNRNLVRIDDENYPTKIVIK